MTDHLTTQTKLIVKVGFNFKSIEIPTIRIYIEYTKGTTATRLADPEIFSHVGDTAHGQQLRTAILPAVS